ncbi:MAG: DUF2891 domain-containing protein [Porticoccaceae bacterium]|jgi:hypothetical protein|nr:DUF2891 domain-containing protein [Porticoccaceae bacterium]MBT6799251.1 DUF2891 domain-containing protein [Porticoccaceae bacterium]
MKYRLFSHFSLIALSVIVGFTLTTSVTAADRETNRTELSLEQAANLMQLPLACAETEYPNKLSQTLRSEEDLASPTDLHPAFYGCFDWHSAVHGHWSMVRLLKEFPDVVGNAQARAILQRHITPENVVKDIDYLRGNISWERPYGWAWLLKLVLELQDWNDPMAASLTTALEPLAEELSKMYIAHLPKLVYPIRVGEHANTAFGLTFALDYARHFDDIPLQVAIKQRAQDFYLQDKNCPIRWEPSGYDFLSPCLEEVDLMRRVLSKGKFMVWLNEFLPELLSPSFDLPVGQVFDRTDGKLVHLDGLNFSRAWVFYALAEQYPELGHLNNLADRHVAYSYPNLVGDSYEGGHWLGSFAINALLP